MENNDKALVHSYTYIKNKLYKYYILSPVLFTDIDLESLFPYSRY